VYRAQGCAKMVWASGGELEMQSGSTLDVQAGVDVDFDDVTLNGTTTATLGAADKVARCLWMVQSQRLGLARKANGDMSTSGQA